MFIELQDVKSGAKLVDLPHACHLTYDDDSCDPRLMALINQVSCQHCGGGCVTLPTAALSIQYLLFWF